MTAMTRMFKLTWVRGEERFFLGKIAGVGKLICCFVLKLEYLIFFTAVTYLPILEGDE